MEYLVLAGMAFVAATCFWRDRKIATHNQIVRCGRVILRKSR